MNVKTFFDHWGLAENPFRAEEARHDSVFARLPADAINHPDFEKIVGDIEAPATSIVFGEKGSGKTALRMQMARRLAEHNAENPNRKALLVPYDDLNPVMDRFCASMGVAPEDDPLPALKRFRLLDHMDAILNSAVERLVDGLLGDPRAEQDSDLDAEALRDLRRADRSVRQDLMLLQAVYDRPERAGQRTRRLRRAIRAPINTARAGWTAVGWLGWILPAGVFSAWMYFSGDPEHRWWLGGFVAALALWGLALIKRFVWDDWRRTRLARRIAKQLRVLHRSPESLAESLAAIPPRDRSPAALPVDGSDDPRYAMFSRLRRVMRALGYHSAVIVLDRIDEPTLISGEPERMKAVVWPLLNSKFLQMEGFGFKLLLPIELRHALFRESSSFFQEARLDKQNLIEQLGWTGATLYDLCDARLQACRSPEAEPMALVDLFDDDVGVRDVVDALDQMNQPRDAFKLLYRCVQEHCSNVTDEQAQRRIPRLVLETVRRQQSDRVQQLFRGVRPA